MKKIVLLVVLSAFFALSQSAIAQNMKGDIGVGIGVAYGFDLEEMGVNVNFNYSFTAGIRSNVDLTYYLADGDVWEANINVHSMFVNDQAFRLYALGGLHIVTNGDNNEIGFNLGTGIEYNISGVMFFAEPKYTVNGFEQLSVTAGVRFSF